MTDSLSQQSTHACEKCAGKGKISYRTIGDALPVDMGNGTTIQDMGGWGVRPCECVRDLPAIHGEAKWWDMETIYSEVVQVPIGSECIEVTADCEVPRREDGRRLHRTPDNVYYPPLVDLAFPGPKVTMHAQDARWFAAALLAAADACDKADEQTDALGRKEQPVSDYVRLRATMTLTLEYDADPRDYVPDGATITPAEMAASDDEMLRLGEFVLSEHPDVVESNVGVTIVEQSAPFNVTRTES